MFKYAEIYGGKIRDVKESALSYIEFVSLFSPKSYWIDVTGVACEIGYVQEFKDGQGIVFVAPPAVAPATEEDIVDNYVEHVQLYLDTTAKERGYDNMFSLATYKGSKIPKFNKEGTAGSDWRDAVWDKCYAILDEIKAGTRPQPTVEQLIAELPIFTWGE